MDVFGLVTLAILLFTFLPFVRYQAWTYSTRLHIVFTLIMYSIAIGLLSNILRLVFISFLIFISFVCPFWFIKMQKYKNTINGPWDEAKLQT